MEICTHTPRSGSGLQILTTTTGNGRLQSSGWQGKSQRFEISLGREEIIKAGEPVSTQRTKVVFHPQGANYQDKKPDS